jgi:hypothetical protein
MSTPDVKPAPASLDAFVRAHTLTLKDISKLPAPPTAFNADVSRDIADREALRERIAASHAALLARFDSDTARLDAHAARRDAYLARIAEFDVARVAALPRDVLFEIQGFVGNDHVASIAVFGRLDVRGSLMLLSKTHMGKVATYMDTRLFSAYLAEYNAEKQAHTPPLHTVSKDVTLKWGTAQTLRAMCGARPSHTKPVIAACITKVLAMMVDSYETVYAPFRAKYVQCVRRVLCMVMVCNKVRAAREARQATARADAKAAAAAARKLARVAALTHPPVVQLVQTHVATLNTALWHQEHPHPPNTFWQQPNDGIVVVFEGEEAGVEVVADPA